MNSARIVFGPLVERAEVEQALRANGWSLTDTHEGDGAWIQHWRRGDDQLAHVEDELFGIRSITTSGDAADAVLRAASTGLDPVSLDVALEMLDVADDDGVIVLCLGLVASCAPPEFEPRAFTALGHRMVHPSETVRLATIAAIMYTHWPEFTRPLEELARLDPNPAIVDQALAAVAYLTGGNSDAGGSGEAG